MPRPRSSTEIRPSMPARKRCPCRKARLFSCVVRAAVLAPPRWGRAARRAGACWRHPPRAQQKEVLVGGGGGGAGGGGGGGGGGGRARRSHGAARHRHHVRGHAEEITILACLLARSRRRTQTL